MGTRVCAGEASPLWVCTSGCSQVRDVRGVWGLGMSGGAGVRVSRVRSRRLQIAIGAALVTSLAGAVLPVSAATASSRKSHNGGDTVVASGLDNPRGLVFLGNGKLAVAEAGHAGDLCLGPGECLGLNGQVSV